MARKTGSHAETTGPRVRAAALRLFAQSGYAAVSMRQIAAEVGMQAGALYTYTADKQTLLFDLMREHMADVLEAWAAQPQGGSPGERLEQFTRFHINHHLDRPEGVFLSYMELRNLTPKNFAEIEALRRSYESELEAILIAGQENGAFSVPDTRLATMALIAMLTGITQWYRDDGRLSRERVQKIYWNMVRRAVKG
ncbi:TetR family transcriptional regulator [Alphaproteobacteria bacterium KMM 3653]|uniref:TetR family transcriptional regulator n=1 Tax=Harenicola maris TaxID=2841044 RepID=A0AAP2CSD0_9RHOB|nr:TetR family transcriptional regulator [Harenicola maris]